MTLIPSASRWRAPRHQALLPVFKTHNGLNGVTVPILMGTPRRYKEAIIIQWVTPKVHPGESRATPGRIWCLSRALKERQPTAL